MAYIVYPPLADKPQQTVHLGLRFIFFRELNYSSAVNPVTCLGLKKRLPVIQIQFTADLMFLFVICIPIQKGSLIESWKL